jgi:predicted ATP-dependent endonuclease of OLD family
VFGDRIVLKDGKLVCANSKVHVGNLAMGAKVFALLKMLLENGNITRNTVLILDEPEVHLHPEWQKILAELLILIMQEIGATILLTTHSSQFLMALETYVKMYKHHDRFKVYSTECLEDERFVKYNDQTESIKNAYYKLAKPVFDIKVLKDSVEE